METPNTNGVFSDLNIAPALLEILNRKGFVSPTPIQKQSIPIAISGKDVIGIAQTGTGKTLAFGIPTAQRLAAAPNTKALILVPTRELAVQVNESFAIFRTIGVKPVVIIGGESTQRQRNALKANPNVIIATPGRLNDLLEQRAVSLANVTTLILDEADRMLDMGFAPQLKKIEQHLPKKRQTMLFSATMDHQIMSIANTFLQLPLRVEVAPAGTTASQITQEVIFVDKDSKTSLLKKVLEEHTGSTLIFCRTKFGAKKVAQVVQKLKHSVTEIHSNRSLNQRLEALNGFKVGKYRVLVATDIAARGIDVTNIALVINFDLPQQSEDYVHRIGRTARAGRTGHAISFATANERNAIRNIERLIKKTLATSRHTASSKDEAPMMEYIPEDTGRRPRPSGGRDFRSRSSAGGYRGNKPSSFAPAGRSSYRGADSYAPSGNREFRPSRGPRKDNPSVYDPTSKFRKRAPSSSGRSYRFDNKPKSRAGAPKDRSWSKNPRRAS